MRYVYLRKVIMPTANSLASNKVVTAGLLVIGDEILSGRTKDKNIGYISEFLTELGIDLREVRVVPDLEETLSPRSTRCAIATRTSSPPAVSGRRMTTSLPRRRQGVRRADRIRSARGRAVAHTRAGRRPERSPHAHDPHSGGCRLVANKVSTAPGFWLGNVIVMAGVPAIMQAMLDEVAPKLKTGRQMLSETIRADAREGDIGTELGAIAAAHEGVVIGSYPFFDEARGPNTNVVIRARDPQKLAAAKEAVQEMLGAVRRAQSKGA